ncbi:MAG: hypothetical protein M1821_005301 [Bathelium mastoideum]|nr:MAG: hypothetical protein M1821_005301 [Bathelium mastoideum]
MAQLALRAFAYGVDKIPDSAWDRVPGGYFRDKEKQRQKQESKRRQDRRARSDSRGRGPRRSDSRNRRGRDEDYYSDTGENAHSYGKHREGYSVPRDGRTLDRNKDPSPPPTDPSPGVPQHESGHYPEAPGHPHGQQHYQNRQKNVNPGINPNQHYFPPPPTQAYDDRPVQPQGQAGSSDYSYAGHGAEHHSHPSQPPNPAAAGYSYGAGNAQFATQYPSAEPSPNPYAPHSGSPAGAAAAGSAFSPPPPPLSSSSASERYRPQHSLNGAATAGPYDRVHVNKHPNQPAAPAPQSAAHARESYVPYSNAVYYTQPSQQQAAYRRGSLGSASTGGGTFTPPQFRSSPRGSISSGTGGGSRPGSRGAQAPFISNAFSSLSNDQAANHHRAPRGSRHARLFPGSPPSDPAPRGRDPQRRAHSAARSDDSDHGEYSSATSSTTAAGNRRAHSASSTPRARLASLSRRLGTDEQGLTAGALGAVVGGVVGHEMGHGGGFATLAGLLVGGLGGSALEGRRKREQRAKGTSRGEANTKGDVENVGGRFS